jgi:CBS domain-containing protein
MTRTQPFQRSYVGPGFEQAHVRDAMRLGVITCRPETTLADVARMMSGYGIHCVVVADVDAGGHNRPWGVVDAVDVAAAGADAHTRTAGEVATTDLVTIESDAPLKRAAELMAEHGTTHLIAVQPGTDKPVGVIAASGLAAVLAWGRPG